MAAVTGASGFVGQRLVGALGARGWRVRVLARRAPARDRGAASPPLPEVVIGDLASARALEALAVGADVLIHAAGLIKAADRAAFFEVNEGGSARVAEAAKAAGTGRVIHISSLAAREPTLSDYAASKRAGESAARAVLGDRLMILRPPAIYGPGDRETLGLFRLAGASPILPTPASRTARLALAHVDDVAAAIVDGLDRSFAPGTFAVGGDRPGGYGWREIFTAAAAALGRSPRLAPLPAWVITGAGALVETLGRACGAPAIFTRGKARELLHDDWSVAEAELAPSAPQARFTLQTGFEHTVAWYREAGWLA